MTLENLFKVAIGVHKPFSVKNLRNCAGPVREGTREREEEEKGRERERGGGESLREREGERA